MGHGGNKRKAAEVHGETVQRIQAPICTCIHCRRLQSGSMDEIPLPDLPKKTREPVIQADGMWVCECGYVNKPWNRACGGNEMIGCKRMGPSSTVLKQLREKLSTANANVGITQLHAA